MTRATLCLGMGWALLGSSGCGWSDYYKEVVTTRDGEGRLVSVVVTERIRQPHNVAQPINFEYIQLRAVNAQSMEPTPTLLPLNTVESAPTALPAPTEGAPPKTPH